VLRTDERPTFRVYAELPSGELLVPGEDASCGGPDSFGACPFPDTSTVRPCAGATWVYGGAERGWRFKFHDDTSICPVTVLDPLGPVSCPLD
jgi:hypothetical protein